MSRSWLDRNTPPHLTTLVLCAATAALSQNVYLPSLPGMSVYFQTDYAVVQLTISLYLAAMAVLQLIVGPASDRFGRRPVILGCFSIFVIASVGAVYAPTIEILLAFRVMQAFAAGGMVLARAIVRDMVGPDEAASRIGYVIMGMSLAPMLGPIVGGLLEERFGWQANFLLMAGFGAVALVLAFFDLGETNRTPSSTLRAQFANYPQLLRSRTFWGYTMTSAFASGVFFAFIGGGPFVATEVLEMSPSQYGYHFAIVSLGYMFGNFLSGRYARRFGINRMITAGNITATFGVLLAVGLFGTGLGDARSLFGSMIFVGIGNGLTLPSANAGVVSALPHIAGSASGAGGAMQIGTGAILSVIAGSVLGADSGVYPLLLVMLGSTVMACLFSLYVIRFGRPPSEPPSSMRETSVPQP